MRAFVTLAHLKCRAIDFDKVNGLDPSPPTSRRFVKQSENGKVLPSHATHEILKIPMKQNSMRIKYLDEKLYEIIYRKK